MEKIGKLEKKGKKTLYWTLHTRKRYANFILHKCNTHTQSPLQRHKDRDKDRGM
jgi:hypothetical protein